MEALLAAWSCANTEHGTGTKKPVPNADGWSINWKERDVNGRPKRDRYLRAPDNTIFRSVAGLQRFFGGHADAPDGVRDRLSSNNLHELTAESDLRPYCAADAVCKINVNYECDSM